MRKKGFVTLAILAGIGFIGSLLIEGPYASELTNGPFGDITAYVGIMKWVCLVVLIFCIISIIVLEIKKSLRRVKRKVNVQIKNKLADAISKAAAPDTTPQETKYKLKEAEKQPERAAPKKTQKADTAELTCMYCGSKVSAKSANCPNCGAALK
ncbi:MAG: hypothetical protein ACI4J1_11055 [Ruminiclostridium sp.]